MLARKCFGGVEPLHEGVLGVFRYKIEYIEVRYSQRWHRHVVGDPMIGPGCLFAILDWMGRIRECGNLYIMWQGQRR